MSVNYDVWELGVGLVDDRVKRSDVQLDTQLVISGRFSSAGTDSTWESDAFASRADI